MTACSDDSSAGSDESNAQTETGPQTDTNTETESAGEDIGESTTSTETESGSDTESETTSGEPLTPAAYFEQVHGLTLADIHFGDTHTHTYYSQDAYLGSFAPGQPEIATPETAYAMARERGLHFNALADHAEAPVPTQIPEDAPASNVWESTRAYSLAAEDTVDDEDSVFIPFMGYEYTNPFPCTDDCPGECVSLGGNESCSAHGHKNVLFRDIDSAPSERVSYLDPAIMNVEGVQCMTNQAPAYCFFTDYTAWAQDNDLLWDWLRDAGFAPAQPGEAPDALTIIHTPGNIHHNDWDAIDSDFVRNVEIFSQWGNSEGAPPEACANQDDIVIGLPPDNVNENADLIRPQIDQRWRIDGDARYALSFVGGSDDHAGKPGGDGDGNGGVTGLITATPTRDALFDAFAQRHTIAATYYSSTGPAPLLVGVEVGDQQLLGGDIGNLAADENATLYVLAGEHVEELELVVDGCTVATFSGNELRHELSDLDPAARHWIYVRARRATGPNDNIDNLPPQTDYDQTWSSPVYLDVQG
ncbi:hypothetical protein G6O69_33705 [Pseudenhygromyxa sp. WMMC2535]|uniref:hypothetical protein n=1 Tax=Pseudenhygromyxa sp. WMMC2535 TaxID=2712867 RepID=UPI001594F6AF|nr:hypothetical protein [Pseudenhygromyxa sp. WMMC2535]NVB42825.1 hypothetical protein [Pseudenhygromyxa sp. WMMC2535]